MGFFETHQPTARTRQSRSEMEKELARRHRVRSFKELADVNTHGPKSMGDQSPSQKATSISDSDEPQQHKAQQGGERGYSGPKLQRNRNGPNLTKILTLCWKTLWQGEQERSCRL